MQLIDPYILSAEDIPRDLRNFRAVFYPSPPEPANRNWYPWRSTRRRRINGPLTCFQALEVFHRTILAVRWIRNAGLCCRCRTRLWRADLITECERKKKTVRNNKHDCCDNTIDFKRLSCRGEQIREICPILRDASSFSCATRNRHLFCVNRTCNISKNCHVSTVL